MKKNWLVFLFALNAFILFGQIGIGTQNPDKSSLLEISATDKGFLPPRVNLTSVKDVTTIQNPAIGLLIYEPDGFTETIGSEVYNREAGVYMYNGNEWQRLLTGDSSSPIGGRNLVGVKIAINQSGDVTLSGSQSYGLLLQNSSVTINPKFVNGIWPSESSSPTDILSEKNGDSGALLFENKLNNQANFFRINFEYTIKQKKPVSTGFFNISITSIASGEVIYSDEILVPGGTDVGIKIPFQLFFPTISDANSIKSGYKITFNVDTAGSSELSNNIGIIMKDILRIN